MLKPVSLSRTHQKIIVISIHYNYNFDVFLLSFPDKVDDSGSVNVKKQQDQGEPQEISSLLKDYQNSAVPSSDSVAQTQPEPILCNGLESRDNNMNTEDNCDASTPQQCNLNPETGTQETDVAVKDEQQTEEGAENKSENGQGKKISS